MRVLAVLLSLTLGFSWVFLPGARVAAAGFEGPGVASTITRAADVLGAQDDAPCVLEAVSYTHLDVYKRQGRNHWMTRMSRRASAGHPTPP